MLAAPTTRYGILGCSATHSIDVKTPTFKDQLREILQTHSVCRGKFTLASGAESDFYVDAKLTTSDPRAALLVGRVGWELLKETARACSVHVDGIGGLTMGGDWMALSIGIVAYLDRPSKDIRTFSVRESA